MITFVVSIWMVGVYALVPGVLVLALGTALSSVYLKCQVSVKREVRYAHCDFINSSTLLTLRSNTKAPVVSQTGTAISGLREFLHHNIHFESQ